MTFAEKCQFVYSLVNKSNGLTHTQLIQEVKEITHLTKRQLNRLHPIPANRLSKHSGLTCFAHR